MHLQRRSKSISVSHQFHVDFASIPLRFDFDLEHISLCFLHDFISYGCVRLSVPRPRNWSESCLVVAPPHSTPSHPNPPQTAFLFTWRSHLMEWRSHLKNGVPIYWAFPITERSQLLGARPWPSGAWDEASGAGHPGPRAHATFFVSIAAWPWPGAACCSVVNSGVFEARLVRMLERPRRPKRQTQI